MELYARTTSFGEEVKLEFMPNAEYPFVVVDGGISFGCISFEQAKEMYDHPYLFFEVPIKEL